MFRLTPVLVAMMVATGFLLKAVACAPCSLPNNGTVEWIQEHTAGAREFPWLVDIRIDEQDDDYWAIGSLLTSKHALTTCRITTLYNVHLYMFTRSTLVSGARVLFCSQYLWEYNGTETLVGNSINSGSRPVSAMLSHPSCTIDPLKFDFGVVEMQYPVNLHTLDMGTLPIYTVMYEKHRYAVRFSEEVVVSCYIATYGREYYSSRGELRDFKVKIPVMLQPLDYCRSFNEYFGCSRCNGEAIPFPEKLTVEAETSYCFSTLSLRNNRLPVCDQDRGAPIMCMRESEQEVTPYFVVGLVSIGVKYEYCQLGRAYPFYVSKAELFTDYLMETAQNQETFFPEMRNALSEIMTHEMSRAPKPTAWLPVLGLTIFARRLLHLLLPFDLINSSMKVYRF